MEDRDDTKKSVMCPRCGSFTRTHSGPDGNISFDDKVDPSHRETQTQGINHVNLGKSINDDLTRCLAAGGGPREAQKGSDMFSMYNM